MTGLSEGRRGSHGPAWERRCSPVGGKTYIVVTCAYRYFALVVGTRTVWLRVRIAILPSSSEHVHCGYVCVMLYCPRGGNTYSVVTCAYCYIALVVRTRTLWLRSVRNVILPSWSEHVHCGYVCVMLYCPRGGNTYSVITCAYCYIALVVRTRTLWLRVRIVILPSWWKNVHVGGKMFIIVSCAFFYLVVDKCTLWLLVRIVILPCWWENAHCSYCPVGGKMLVMVTCAYFLPRGGKMYTVVTCAYC